MRHRSLLTLYLLRVNPDVIAGRVNRHERPRRWDLLLGLLVALPAMLAIPIVAALDDGRYHWSHVPWWGCALGYALLLVGFAGLTWAQAVNKFFEPSVRIQTDRGHHVIDTGPYAIIRHPGYAFGFAFFLGIPLALGSLWGLIPAMLMSAAPGRADGPGGSDAPERVAGLQGIRPAGPIPADSWGLVMSADPSP